MSLDPDRFEALTFDCYGTLIDWERGILAALAPIVGEAVVAGHPDGLLASFARHESAAEAGPYVPYREVLRRCARGICAERGLEPPDALAQAFAASVADWPPFPDSASALERLARRFRMGVITNCDDDLFAASAERLGIAWDVVVTAQQVGSYKPSERNFLEAFERLLVPRERILHVAQSLFHDHVPAKHLGLATCWVDRRAGRAGSGATPAAVSEPDLVVPDLATLAERLVGAASGD